MRGSPKNYAGLHSRSRPPPLTTWLNGYGDLQTTREAEFEREPARFDAQLAELLARPDAVRGVWLRLPYAECAPLLPVLARRGFQPHHWDPASGHLVLQAWLPAAPNPTPPHAHVDVGCGALVVNRRGQLLGICERFDGDRWGVPGGHLDPGEDLLACGAREAREETGVACAALGIVGIHETQMPWSRPQSAAPLTDAQRGSDEHALRWGTTHCGVYVLCFALGDGALSPDPKEVSVAAWLDPADWGKLPAHVRVLVAGAQASGQIAAAARAAALGCAVPVPGLIAAASLPLPSRHGGQHAHVFYHAQHPPAFAHAVAGAGLGAPARLLGTGSAAMPLPPPSALARAWTRAAALAPVLGALVLGAGLLGLSAATGYSLGRGMTLTSALQALRLPRASKQ
jgi:8-oxo-dGTP pyrophosphatase MutT (NUDIX family)